MVSALLLYAASPGPIFMLTDYLHNQEPRWIGTFYQPLVIVYDKLPHRVTDVYDDYIGWWDSLRHH